MTDGTDGSTASDNCAGYVCTKCGWFGPESALRIEGRLKVCPRCPYLVHRLPDATANAARAPAAASRDEVWRQLLLRVPGGKLGPGCRAAFCFAWDAARAPTASPATDKAVPPATAPTPPTAAGSIREAFQALRDAGGSDWDKVADPEALVREIRGEDSAGPVPTSASDNAKAVKDAEAWLYYAKRDGANGGEDIDVVERLLSAARASASTTEKP